VAAVTRRHASYSACAASNFRSCGNACSIASRPAAIERLRAPKSALPTPLSTGRSTTSASRNSKLLMVLPMMAKVCSRICREPSAALASGVAQEQVVNLYSARHYSTDEALYTNFTKATGIKINRVDADDAGILARLKAEGSASARQT
jgi:hypothetical protein